MAPKGAHVGVIASVLGYCILPIVILSVINILIDLKGIIGTVASIAAVLWSVPPKSTLDNPNPSRTRIPTVKLKIPGKSIFEIRIRTSVKNIFYIFQNFFMVAYFPSANRCYW